MCVSTRAHMRVRATLADATGSVLHTYRLRNNSAIHKQIPHKSPIGSFVCGIVC